MNTIRLHTGQEEDRYNCLYLYAALAVPFSGYTCLFHKLLFRSPPNLLLCKL